MKSRIFDLTLWRNIYRLCIKGNVTTLSASLAYYMLFSLLPALAAARGIVSAFPSIDLPLEELVEARLPKDVAVILEEVFLKSEKSSSGGAFTGGILISVFAFTRFIRSLKIHMEKVSGEKRRHSYIGSWIFSLSMSVSALLVLFLSLAALVFGEQILKLLSEAFYAERIFLLLWGRLRVLALFLLLVLFLALLFYFLPSPKKKLVHVFPAVAFTSFCWMVSGYVFSFYVNAFAHRSLAYASFGGFVILISWLYVLSLIILIGANINVAFCKRL